VSSVAPVSGQLHPSSLARRLESGGLPAGAGNALAGEWMGRLVRVLLVFRGLVLLITLLLLPPAQRTPVAGIAVICAAAVSYVPLRHWPRIADSVSRHPLYLALEVLLATLILAAAGARSPFFYFTLGTAALAGVIYGRRGAIPFSALLMAAYELVALEGLPTMHALHDAQSIVFAPLLYPAAVAAGVAARELVERGIETEALLRERTESLAGERERLRVARELHDSLAKTVEGLAMSASMLPTRCERNPVVAAAVARQLAEDARQAALEARALMSDLRPGAELELPLAEAVRRRAESFAARTGLTVRVGGALPAPLEPSPATRHELLRIVGEALLNAARHGGASEIVISLVGGSSELTMSVSDNGRGLRAPVDLEALKADGHFGIAGMHERARGIGGTLELAPGPSGGTVVTVSLPLRSEAAPVHARRARRRRASA
jgi:signal transduction histidine kinase